MAPAATRPEWGGGGSEQEDMQVEVDTGRIINDKEHTNGLTGRGSSSPRGGLDPILLQVGPIGMRGPGVLISLGVVVGTLILVLDA